MSRRSRRLHVRLARSAALTAGGVFAYRRWELRASGASPTSAFQSAVPQDGDLCSSTVSSSPAPRLSRWRALQRSTIEEPFDLLVVGGGVTGLYTAVDAAQRGLRVALVEASDIGGGSTTSCVPSMTPGALPYVQRAIRQRDVGWLSTAATVLAEQATWCRVAGACVVPPDTLRSRWTRYWRLRSSEESTPSSDDSTRGTAPAPPPPMRTLLPALHLSEAVELACAAVIGTVLSVLCGPLRPDAVLTRSAVEKRLPALASGASATSAPLRVRGGVVSNDFALHGNAAAVSLARTAEALGVVVLTYAPVCALSEAAASGSALEPAPPVMSVSVRDALAGVEGRVPGDAAADHPLSRASAQTWWWSRWASSSSHADPRETPELFAHEGGKVQALDTAPQTRVYARAVVNCAGCWVDAVKAMYDGNTRDALPTAFAGYQAYSYLVAPAAAVHAAAPACADVEDSTGGAPSAGVPRPPLHESTRASGLLFSSPRLSFATAAVLPWLDGCVLLGPVISTLPHLPDAITGGAQAGLMHARDGYAAQLQRTTSVLRGCGVDVDGSRVLSCVTQVVPHLGRATAVPWAADLLFRGYALHFSSVPLQERRCEEEPSAFTDTTTAGTTQEKDYMPRRDVPLLHVYGGPPVLARRVAEDVVDALVHHEPALFPREVASRLRGCRTRHLRLSTPASLDDDPAADAQARLAALITDTYAERLVDVVARRTHIAFTSPVEALQALPALSRVMAGLRGWEEARRQAEVEAAAALVRSVAVSA